MKYLLKIAKRKPHLRGGAIRKKVANKITRKTLKVQAKLDRLNFLESDVSYQVREIIICHQRVDHTKWSVGMTLTYWLADFECLESSMGAKILENAIMVKAQELLQKDFLTQQLALSIRFYHSKSAPDYHRHAYSQLTFIVEHSDLRDTYKIRIRFHPYAFTGQLGIKGTRVGIKDLWHKGSITITSRMGRRFQIIKWR